MKLIQNFESYVIKNTSEEHKQLDKAIVKTDNDDLRFMIENATEENKQLAWKASGLEDAFASILILITNLIKIKKVQ